MSFPSQEDVQSELEPFEPDILEIVQGAWEDFLVLGIQAKLRYKRNRAGLVHDFMVQRAIAKWPEGSGVTWLEKDETAKFIFGKKVIVRFKKADENGLGSNIMTQAVLAFVDPQMSLPGIPEELIKVEVLYSLNALATQIETVAVVARDGDRELWSYIIEDRRGSVVVQLPLGPAPSTEPDVVIVPKGVPGKEKNG